MDFQKGDLVIIIEPVALEFEEEGVRRYKPGPSPVQYVVDSVEDDLVRISNIDESITRHIHSDKLFKSVPDLKSLKKCRSCLGWGQVKSICSNHGLALVYVECPNCESTGFLKEVDGGKEKDEA